MLHNSYWALSTLSAIGRTTPDANKAVLPRLLDELGKEKENNVSKVSDGLRITMDMISDLGSEGEEFISIRQV